jgi:hypothetical protein
MRRPSLHNQKVGDLGELLRQTYDDVLREPLPDRLRELIEKLEGDGTLFFREARATENGRPPSELDPSSQGRDDAGAPTNRRILAASRA